ncbi:MULTISPECIES: SGNH/GDSL hydrolase family protein [unclassified Halomonas]|uniref:SGNH/GDSL hydrolase family protein n=1 Tax=unclassified Halomonas TaxID=2609666 RepID=UPI003CECC3B0
MNVLFIGGSNLVIKNGVSTLIPKSLIDAGEKVDEVYNIAVGATSCLFGLESLTLFKKKEVDLVFIEYGINDLPLYANDRSLWEKSFTALLLLVKDKFPNAHVVTILLGRQKERFWNNQQRMHQKMTVMSEKAGALVIDVDKELKSKVGSTVDFKDFYLDESHYASPNVTQYIASIVVGDYMLNRSLGFFDNARKNSKQDALGLYGLPGQIACYENSRFHKQTTILEKNEAIEIKVKGTPVAISFISANDSCSLLVEAGNKKKIINTKRKKSTLGKFSFILKQIPLYGMLDKASNDKSIQTIKLTAIDKLSPLWNDEIVQRTYGMDAAGSQDKNIYISHLSTF